jgi:uncharacterized membrane protein YbhN (UPF0104 family)
MTNSMVRRLARSSVIALITLVCTWWTLRVFDWRSIAHALRQLRIAEFIFLSFGAVVLIFTIRGIRWLTVLGIPFDRRRLLQSIFANGAAVGIASITPFQLGEVIKLRMIPDHHGSAWRVGVSAFFLERILDLSGVCGIGLCGLLLHVGKVWMAGMAALAPLWCSQMLLFLAPLSQKLPSGWIPYTALLHQRWPVTVAGILTAILWLLYTAMWWIAADSIHVRLSVDQVCLLIGSVMLTVVASMTPGGLGVAELGTRGILMWLGKSQSEADAAAIGLRLLTLVLMVLGGICLVVSWKCRRGIFPKSGGEK